MGEAKTELLRGTLDMLILKVVALGPSHGYAIAQRLQQISKDFFQVHQGSLYPALHRLEDRGWLQAEWKESETGREAKFLRTHHERPEADGRRGCQLGAALRRRRLGSPRSRRGVLAMRWIRHLFQKSRSEKQLDQEDRLLAESST
jgi:transcriptional regulator